MRYEVTSITTVRVVHGLGRFTALVAALALSTVLILTLAAASALLILYAVFN